MSDPTTPLLHSFLHIILACVCAAFDACGSCIPCPPSSRYLLLLECPPILTMRSSFIKYGRTKRVCVCFCVHGLLDGGLLSSATLSRVGWTDMCPVQPCPSARSSSCALPELYCARYDALCSPTCANCTPAGLTDTLPLFQFLAHHTMSGVYHRSVRT